MEFLRNIKNLPRHCKTAIQNIWRNGVMSVSSIFAVTITLTLIAIVSVIAMNVNTITREIESNLTIYVKVERKATHAQSIAVGEAIKKIDHVAKITYSSKEDELEKLIAAQNEENKSLFESYRKDNPLGDAYSVEVTETSKLEEVSKAIEDIQNVNEVTYGGSNTNKLVSILEAIRNGGAFFVVALTVLALFMIYNTIRITINARNTEISIMRMVGASNWYIRLPFMLEGILIGIIGAIIPIVILYYGYQAAVVAFENMMSTELITLTPPFPFIYKLSGLLVAMGSGVGLIGSFFSVRRYLKF